MKKQQQPSKVINILPDGTIVDSMDKAKLSPEIEDKFYELIAEMIINGREKRAKRQAEGKGD